jgi:hypothetical protein
MEAIFYTSTPAAAGSPRPHAKRPGVQPHTARRQLEVTVQAAASHAEPSWDGALLL